MRYIRTTNNIIEFLEADDSGKVLTSRGFNFAELYFLIKNGKVTFYLKDQENPWRNDVWTINIPFELDGEMYDNEDDASAALSALMIDKFQEQIDQLREDLDNEIIRAVSAETRIEQKLDDEIARSVSADTRHDAEIARLDQKIDDETAARISGDTYLEGLINAETLRAETAESAITNALNNEIQRATSAETVLHDEILAEETRALAAESALTSALNAEITRSTNKDTEHDTLISGLTSDLADEVANRISGDTNLQNQIDALDDKVDAEILRSTNKDTEHDALISGLSASIDSLDDKIDQEIADRISGDTRLENLLNSEVSRAISAETILHEEILAERNRALAAESALTSNLNSEIVRSTAKDAEHDALISGLTNSLNNEITRATTAENSLRNDLNTEISARTSSDNTQNQRITALETGKADRTELNNYYTKTESDAKYATKEYISGLTENIYTKDETDALLAEKQDKLSAGTHITIIDNVISADGVASGDVQDMIDQSVSGKADTSAVTSVYDALTAHTADTSIHFTTGDVQNQISSFTYDKATIDEKVASGGTFDPTNYYTKGDVDSRLSAKTDNSDFSAHTADTSIHFTTGDVQSMITAATSGLQQTLSAGTNVQINNNVISATDTTYTAGDGISISNQNVISTVTKFVCVSESEWSSISGNPQSNTVYLIH